VNPKNKLQGKKNIMYQDMLAFTGHEWGSQLSLLNLTIAKMEHVSGDQWDMQKQDIVRRIRYCVAAMQRISRSYLNAKYVDHSTFTPHPALLDPVKDVIDPVLFGYAGAFSKSGQTCQIKCNPTGATVWADRDLLLSVYDNLIGNAIRHGETGGQIILNVLANDTESQLSVWNSGPGIAPESLASIFECFTTHSDNQESHGLGLYLVRQIVEAHGGQVWADSHPGSGVRFTFTLPGQLTE
jgi:signal transduction histidine kinase